MKETLFELKPCDSLPCRPDIFIVNGKDADTYDFGYGEDEEPEKAERWACANHRFKRYAYTDTVLAKYDITAGQYGKICDALEEILSPGSCGWCI